VQPMTEPRLAEITERVMLWRDFADDAAFTANDAAELLREVNWLRAAHDRDVKLLRRCRDELIRVNDEYQDLIARAEAWAAQEAEQDGDLAALLAQDQAEEGTQE
jgi:hypothetical protein